MPSVAALPEVVGPQSNESHGSTCGDCTVNTSRTLDLDSALTVQGAVGLEGLSRGCEQAHFVENDPWVIKKVLDPNVTSTGFKPLAVVHQEKVEDFLVRSNQTPALVGGAFDFVSVTPPYLLVSYPELYDLLDESPLIHNGSTVIVEYSAQNKADIRDSIGPLQLVRDRRYGRTFVAVYATA
jgi:16S rRNA G966 N2-methylase RsmD